ncbi:MAG: FecR domain-containing protein [Chitinophagaceae bacterium]|nr:FecR domain-containing protein [Chitinophagaceae bacterium]
MQPIPEHIRVLLRRRFDGEELSEAERSAIRDWYRAEEAEGRLMGNENWEKDFLEYIRLKHDQQYKDDTFRNLVIAYKEKTPRVIRISSLRKNWLRYAAAILIISGIGAYLWNSYKPVPAPTAEASAQAVEKDVLPGSDKAILTLADGQKVSLDSQANELLKQKGIINNNALLVYSDKKAANEINTLATPNGGQYKIKLSDGTMVWLNAASSITYPTAFTNNTREVSITGEAYFEVTKNKSKPFIVSVASKFSPFEKGGGAEINRNADSRGIYQITVLGTEFNINAYPDEISKTSLISGSVRVSENPPAGLRSPQTAATPFSKGGGYILKSGEAYSNNQIIKTNIAQDISWKNGAFDFTDMDLRAVFRQLERWYNITVKYEGELPAAKLKGQMGRDFNLSQVLKAFKEMGINTRLEGNTLIVLSK